MSIIAGIEVHPLRGKRGHVIVQSRVILSTAVVGEAKYPVTRVADLKGYASIDKEIAKIEGRLHSLLKDLPVTDIQTVEAVLDDVFSKSNLDFRFPVALALVNALAEDRATDAAVLLGGEFLSSVPLPVVEVACLQGPFRAPLDLLATAPLEDRWFFDPPIQGDLAFDLDQPEALAQRLQPVLDQHGLLVDLRALPMESGPFHFLGQVSSRIHYLLELAHLSALGKLSPPNLSEILERTVLHLDLNDLSEFLEVYLPILPVKTLLLTVPASHGLTRTVQEVQDLDDHGFSLLLDSRADTYGRLGLYALARGLRFRHIWVEASLESSLGIVNKAAALGRKRGSMVYRPLVERA